MAGELFACAAAAASMLVSVRESSRYVCVYEEGQEEEGK
jgi:DNA relaxase NicK